MKKIIIIGASGHGKVIADIIIKSNNKLVGFLDDNPNIEKQFCGYPILGNILDYKKYKTNHNFIIAIGNADIRQKIVKQLENVCFYTAIHPSAQISNIDVKIGKGTVVMANAIINSGTQVGNHCIINSGSIVEHDNYIENFVHISVGAKLAGTVHIGEKTWIGIGAIVNNNLTICNNCLIGAGAVVIKNINESGIYIGIPAHKLLGDKLK